MKKVLFIMLAGTGFQLFAINPVVVDPVNTVKLIESSFKVEEETAAFPGGEMALNLWFNQHMKYPKMAKEQGITGKVVLSFTIDTEGKATDIQVIQTPGGGLEEEAIRLLSLMPNWNPKKQAGNLLSTRKIFSFNFQL